MARGTFRVLFLTVDLDAAQQGMFSETSFLNQGAELQKFYTREAERIVGKPMVEFRYTFGGHQQWSIPDGQFLFLSGRETVREYLQRQLPQLQLKDFQFIVLAVPTLPTHQIGEVNGYYLGEGVTTIRAVTGAMHAASMAHEFAHAFGCSDLWMGGVNRYYLCNERRANNLMCGAETHAPELVWFDRIQNGYTTLAYRRLDDCAAEMGWGDADNDGIVDIEDSSVP
ncbi:MAG: hypothetical protein HY461_00955 [Parcubacteria group bacterium]|nr:hypothetical protein [Parcubacteria group bacterium]